MLIQCCSFFSWKHTLKNFYFALCKSSRELQFFTGQCILYTVNLYNFNYTKKNMKTNRNKHFFTARCILYTENLYIIIQRKTQRQIKISTSSQDGVDRSASTPRLLSPFHGIPTKLQVLVEQD